MSTKPNEAIFVHYLNGSDENAIHTIKRMGDVIRVKLLDSFWFTDTEIGRKTETSQVQEVQRAHYLWL